MVSNAFERSMKSAAQNCFLSREKTMLLISETVADCCGCSEFSESIKACSYKLTND